MRLRPKQIEEIEAVQWTGCNAQEVWDFCPEACSLFYNRGRLALPDMEVVSLDGETTTKVNYGDFILKVDEEEYEVLSPSSVDELYYVIDED